MSAILETTPAPAVFSRAETQTGRDPEIETCERLAHKVTVIAGGSTSMGLATAKRFVQDGMDQVSRKRLHKGESHANDSRELFHCLSQPEVDAG
jgi:hypothetical protein